jgi:hypothetical protein
MTDFKKHQAECCRCLRQLYSQLHGTVKQVDHLSQGVQGWPEQQNKTLSLKKKKKKKYLTIMFTTITFPKLEVYLNTLTEDLLYILN